MTSTNSAKGLLILEEEDFELVDTGKVTHLTHTIEGKFSIVMFYTDECDQCRIVKPILLSLVGNSTIQVCMVNVYDQDSTNIIQLSQKTTTPLQHVPFIVFYVNGIPFKRFDGSYTLSDFQTFVKNVMVEASKIKDTNEIGEIPPYTIGKPNSSKVCYLTYQKAY
jgi:thioredoxin-like negative regulator of GroEL